MLSCMQDLKRLPFDRVLPICSREFISSATFNTFQTIYLPHLSRLRVATALSTVIAFLSCMNIPLKIQVRLKCDTG